MISSTHGSSYHQRPRAAGLAAVACYDPYFDRMKDSIRHCLADGHPVLVRLHSAAQYPAPDGVAYSNDLEGHAVLIIGYDDDEQAFAVSDPWDTRWGGERSGTWWIPYNRLPLEVVDSTKDFYLIAAPLQATASINETRDGRRELVVGVRFYAPEGIVMDQDHQTIRKVAVSVAAPAGLTLAGSTRAEVSGSWHVGQTAYLSYPLSSVDVPVADVVLSVKALVAGARPYRFEDETSIRITCRVEVPSEYAGAVR